MTTSSASDPVHDRWERQAGVLWRRTGTTVLLMTPPRGELLVLDDTGSMLWELLERSSTLVELAQDLARAYDVPAERVATDIAPVLTDLEDRAVLRRRNAA